MKNYLRFGIWIFVGFCILSLGSSAQAWRADKALLQEIKDKKAQVAANPSSALDHFDLAITYAYTNHIQEGWDELKKVEALDPNFRKTGLKLYIDKVNQLPQDWKLRFRLAFAYYFNQEKVPAIRELDNVLILDPYNVWAYGYIALIYGEMNQTSKAMDYTKRGLKIDSNVAALHLLLAEGYNRQGNKWGTMAEGFEALRLRALGF